MNLNKEKLNKAYRTIAAFVKTSSSGLNGSQIIMKAEKGVVTFKYEDGSVICRYSIPCNSNESFSYLVRLKCIGEATKFRGDVDLSISNHLITFTDGTSSVTERVGNSWENEPYPPLVNNEENTITVNPAKFWKMLKCIKDIQQMPQSTSDKNMLYLTCTGQQLTAVSMTGSFVAKKMISVTGNSQINWSGMLVKRYIDLIQYVKDNDSMTLHFHPNCIEVESGDIYMRIALLNGCIANYDIPLDTNSSSKFSLMVKDTLDYLDELASIGTGKLFCKGGKDNKIRFEVEVAKTGKFSQDFRGKDNKIRFEVEEGKNRILCSVPLFEHSGDAFDFQVDFKNFYDLLNEVYDCSIMTFKYNPDDRGIIFFSEDKSFLGAIVQD